LVLTPLGFQSVIFLTSFVSSILSSCPHHFILCVFIHIVLYIVLWKGTIIT
jgi:hypothetical protein